MSSEFVDDKAEREDEDKAPEFHDSSEEDDDEDQEYENDGFIVQDDAEEDGNDDDDDDFDAEPGSGISRKKKSKRKRRRKYREDSPELADGDLLLLEDTGLHVNRKKKLRRLKKGASDDEGEEIADELRNLADDYDDEYDDSRRNDDRDIDYDDEMDDFIDDGGRGKRRRAAERKGMVSSDAMRQARSIFGDADEMQNYRPSQGMLSKPDGTGIMDDDPDDPTYGEEPEEEDDDEIGADVGLRKRAGGRIRARAGDDEESERTAATIRAIASTSLEESVSDSPKIQKEFVQPDIPERLIKHFGPGYTTPSSISMKTEADWIYDYAFRLDQNCGFQQYTADDVKSKIQRFLEYVHQDKLDVPFIAMYRKDYILPELVCEVGENQRGDGPSWDAEDAEAHKVRGFNSFKYDGFRPGLSIEHLRGVEPGYDDGFGDWSTLWKIVDWDKRYMELSKRKVRLLASASESIGRGVSAFVVDSLRNAINLSSNELQIADCERFLKMNVDLATANRWVATGGVEDVDDGKKSRRPSKRKNRYMDYVKRGYRNLTEFYGMSPKQFADNVHAGAQYGFNVQGHVPTDYEDEPLECARQFARNAVDERFNRGQGPDNDPSRLLAAARHILVKEMCAELLVIQSARTILNKEGTVTIDTHPTSKGIQEIDESNPLRQVTYLSGKRIESLVNTYDFMLIKNAVENEYTKLSIKFQDEQVHHLSEILLKSFSSPNTGHPLNEKWNAERKLVANEVLEELKKQIRGEIYRSLFEQASEVLQRQVTQTYSRRFLLGPTRPSQTGGHDDGAPKVLAFVVTREEEEEPDKLMEKREMEEMREKGQKRHTRRPAKDRITMVVVNENGEFVSSEELFAGWLMRPYSKETPEEVVKELRSYIAHMRPRAIVVGVGSGGKSAIRLKDDIRLVLVNMLQSEQLNYMLTPEQLSKFQADVAANQNTDNVYRFIDPYVTCIDEWPAKMYALCKWSDVGLPVDGITLLEKRALALGRIAQEPLTIYTSIGSDSDLNSKLAMHPYHYHLRPSQRVLALERALIRGVCTAGVDINRLLSLPHQKPMLRYVGGLGEHKGNTLLKKLEKMLTEDDKALLSRKQLWTKEYMGKTVFMSAAAFLRVRDPELHFGGSTVRAREHRNRIIRRSRRGNSEEGSYYDPMDDSRIHPEHYAVAIKIADEALRDDEGNLRFDVNAASGISVAMRVTSAVLEDPSGLRRLALDEYAQHLFNLKRGRLYETVKLIAREFHGIYADFRRPLVSPHSQAIFYMVTKASPLDFRIGTKVTATNCRVNVNYDSVNCWLPYDIRGIIGSNEFSDERLTSEQMRELVPDGASVPCRILSCEWDRFRVRLSSKVSVLQNPNLIYNYTELINTQDTAYRHYPKQSSAVGLQGNTAQNAVSMGRQNGEDQRRRRRLSTSQKREKAVVNHRHFRDINGPTAVETLRNALPGDVIIRPSAYNKDAFVFSCKFAGLPTADSAVPRDIFHIEFIIERDPTMPNEMARLRIGTESFDDVDEALTQFVHPIVGNLKEGLEHRKFKPGGEEAVRKLIKEFKKENMSMIPYFIGLSEKMDLHFFMAYIPGSTTVLTEYIQVIPHGYRFRDVLHNNLDSLCTWFKKNMTKGAAMRPQSTIIPASPFTGMPAAGVAQPTPVFDAPPPAVSARSPFHPSAGSAPARNPSMSAARSPFIGSGPPAQPIKTNGQGNWGRDMPPPPPPPMQGNGRHPFSRGGGPPPPGQEYPMRDRPPPQHHRGPPPPQDYRIREHGPPQPYMQRGPPRRASPPRGPPMGRGMPPPHMGGRGMGPGIGRGPPPMGRGAPMGRGGGGAADGMAPWRGSKPIPAWKQKELEAQAQQQRQG